VAHLDYSAMVKQRSLGPDNMEDGTDPSSAFLDALRTRAMDEMHEAALEYGIVLKDLAVIDRQFKGMYNDISETLHLHSWSFEVKSLRRWISLQHALCKLKWRLPYAFLCWHRCTYGILIDVDRMSTERTVTR
jgi:hypothetical protein